MVFDLTVHLFKEMQPKTQQETYSLDNYTFSPFHDNISKLSQLEITNCDLKLSHLLSYVLNISDRVPWFIFQLLLACQFCQRLINIIELYVGFHHKFIQFPV